MSESEHCFSSPYTRAETERRLIAFLDAQALNPAGIFHGNVKDGWVRVRASGFRLFGFEYRGEIRELNDACTVELLITPTPVTMVALLFIAVPVFLGFVFAVMLLGFGWGFVEGGALARGLQVLLMLLLAALVALALIEPRKTRRKLLALLRDAALAK